MDPIAESFMRSQQFRGPVPHEAEVRQIASELVQAYQEGRLTGHDLRTLADCLETAVRKSSRIVAV